MLLHGRASVEQIAAVVGLGSAPFLLGFLVLAPYFGPFIARLLYVWSLILMRRLLWYSFRVDIVEGALCAAVGWLLMLLLSHTVGRPIVALRDWLRTRLVGQRRFAGPAELLAAYTDRGDPDRDGPG